MPRPDCLEKRRKIDRLGPSSRREARPRGGGLEEGEEKGRENYVHKSIFFSRARKRREEGGKWREKLMRRLLLLRRPPP